MAASTAVYLILSMYVLHVLAADSQAIEGLLLSANAVDTETFLNDVSHAGCVRITPSNHGYVFEGKKNSGIGFANCPIGGRCVCRMLEPCKEPVLGMCFRPFTCMDLEGRKRCYKIKKCTAYGEKKFKKKFVGYAACDGKLLNELTKVNRTEFAQQLKAYMTSTCDIAETCEYKSDHAKDIKLGSTAYQFQIPVKGSHARRSLKKCIKRSENNVVQLPNGCLVATSKGNLLDAMLPPGI